jgi:chromosome segregation ATPase
MEMAHQLIGITMDEPGVSRVIHLELEPRQAV